MVFPSCSMPNNNYCVIFQSTGQIIHTITPGRQSLEGFYPMLLPRCYSPMLHLSPRGRTEVTLPFRSGSLGYCSHQSKEYQQQFIFLIYIRTLQNRKNEIRFLALQDCSSVNKEKTPATLEINVFILQQPRYLSRGK